MANRVEQEKVGKEGLLRDGVHRELIEEIMSLTDEEVRLVTHLLASSQILLHQEQPERCLRPYL